MSRTSPDAVLVCVECGHPLSSVYKEYSRGNIRLSRCRKCRAIGDKYVEFESVLILIDMLLHRLSVYRHLLINRLNIGGDRREGRRLPSYWKVLIVFLALEVYTRLYVSTLDRYSPAISWQTALTSHTPQPHTAYPLGLSELCVDHLVAPVRSHEAPSADDNATEFRWEFRVDLLQQHTSLKQQVLAGRKAFHSELQRWKKEHRDTTYPDVWQEGLRCAGAACVLRFRNANQLLQANGTTRLDGTDVSILPHPLTSFVFEEEECDVGVADIGDAVWQLPSLPFRMACCLIASVLEMAAYTTGVCIAAYAINVLASSRIRLDPVTGLPRVQPPRSRRSLPSAEALGIDHLPPPMADSGIRIRRSISTGNTQAADEIRNEMLSAERDKLEGRKPVMQPHQHAQTPAIAEPSGVPASTDVARDTFSVVKWLRQQQIVQLLHVTAIIEDSREVIDPSPPTRREYAQIAHAMLIASFVKVFVTLSMVWNYPVGFLYMITVFTLSSHTTAIQAVCDCTAIESAVVVMAGYACWLTTRFGLYEMGVIEKFTAL